MQKECMDGFFRKFDNFGEMIDYHKKLSANSIWVRRKVNELYVAALDMTSSLLSSTSLFAPGTSEDAVMDTVSNMGLAMQVEGEYYPMRSTAYKSLLDRANAMTRVCKKLALPKKAAVEAIAMFEMANGDNPATAHDVFMAMQEIPYILKTQGTPESKMLTVEERIKR